MGHYSKVLNGKVINCIVAEAEFFDTFIDDSPGEWIQTSYNTRGGIHYQPNTDIPSEDQSKALRYNFGSIDMLYDSVADAFYRPQPYPSWILNTTTYLWEPPVPYPTDEQRYDWNEETQQWELVT